MAPFLATAMGKIAVTESRSYYVYGLQAISQHEGPVKIGFSHRPIDRLLAHEPGALGERLHVIFQIEAGTTYREGRRLEHLYHKRFSATRLNREWFRFQPQMLSWRPDGTQRIYAETRSPASNTIAAGKLAAGDISIFQRHPSPQRPFNPALPSPGDLAAARDVQAIVQRHAISHHSAAQRIAPPLSALRRVALRRAAAPRNSTHRKAT